LFFLEVFFQLFVCKQQIDPMKSKILFLVLFQFLWSVTADFCSGGGITQALFGPSMGVDSNGIGLQSDGKFVVGGQAYTTSYIFAIVRFTSTGALDPSFGDGGVTRTPITSGVDQGYALAVQSDDKILLVGRSNTAFTVVRYLSDGSLDNSFGTLGIVRMPLGTASVAHDVALTTEGKIVVVGTVSDGSGSKFLVVRYLSNGSLDSSFGSAGVVNTAIDNSTYAGAFGVTVASDGKLIVVGQSNPNSNPSFTISRYNTDGVLDSSFGGTGVVVMANGSANGGAYAVAIQSDGKVGSIIFFFLIY
jgi:uncharacterized delta-60 repeat protein